jgi:hypothetical protein
MANFTIVPPADDAPPPSSTGAAKYTIVQPPSSPPDGYKPAGSFVQGLADPLLGLAQLSTDLGISGVPEIGMVGLPEQPVATAADTDRFIKQNEAAYQAQRKAEGKTGTDWGRGAGDLVMGLGLSAPLAGAVPEMGGAGLLAKLGMGAARGGVAGASTAAMEPVTKGNFARQKLEQSLWGAGSGAILGTILAPLGHALATDDPGAAERFVIDTYRRYVKPSAAGVSTASQLDKLFDTVRGALSSVVRNKENLSLTDATGGIVKGELPASLDQAAQAIEQTKQAVFDRYDKMTKGADEAGVMVGLMPAANELREVAQSVALKTARPEVARYAEDMAARLEKQMFISPADAQKTIKYYNDALKAFYRQPSYDKALNAMVDGLVANNLRAGLDTAISEVVAPGYQALKLEYGALRAVEDQVVKRAQVSGRQFPGGGLLGTFGNLYSGPELVRAALTLDPAALVRGVATKGFVEVMKHLRSPDRAIRRMFETADRLEKMPPPSATRKAAQGAADYLPFGAGATAGVVTGDTLGR